MHDILSTLRISRSPATMIQNTLDACFLLFYNELKLITRNNTIK